MRGMRKDEKAANYSARHSVPNIFVLMKNIYAHHILFLDSKTQVIDCTWRLTMKSNLIHFVRENASASSSQDSRGSCVPSPPYVSSAHIIME